MCKLRYYVLNLLFHDIEVIYISDNLDNMISSHSAKRTSGLSNKFSEKKVNH